MSYDSKVPAVQEQQLKVQRLVLPFKITANATPASVTIKSDASDVLFLRTEGVDQITVAAGALSSADVAPTFGDSPVDSTGVFNALIKIGEKVQKVCSARLYRRGATIATSAAQLVSLGTATGIVQLVAGGDSDKFVLSCDASVSLATTDFDACLEVEYIVAE